MHTRGRNRPCASANPFTTRLPAGLTLDAKAVPEVLDALSHGGEAFLTPTVYQGVPAIRAAFSNWRTTAADTDRICRALGV